MRSLSSATSIGGAPQARLQLKDFSRLLALTVLVSGAPAVAARAPSWERPYRPVKIEEAHVRLGHARDTALDPESLKVLVWNIKKAELPLWRKEFLELGHGKDLLLLQETYGSDLFLSTLGLFGSHRWDMGVSFLYTRINNTPTGSMIGSAVSPSTVLVQHSPDLEPFVFTPKAITFASYPVRGSRAELLAVSVHGINFTDAGAFERQMLRAKKVIEGHQGPVVFAGDFNTWSGQRTRFLRTLTKDLGLGEVEFPNGGRRMTGPFSGLFLDHAFIRGLRVKRAEVVEASLGSDHKPLDLELEVLGPELE